MRTYPNAITGVLIPCWQGEMSNDLAMLECVVNLSEGRDQDVLDQLASVCGADLLDRHCDPDHNRSVFTLIGEVAPRALAREAVARLDLTDHAGAHPRLGVVDVVPFVPLGEASLDGAVAARDAFAAWAGRELLVPCFRYGPERTLPEVRRRAFVDLEPDTGPLTPHPTAGAACVGARSFLVAYNVWLAEPDLDLARRVAAAVRSPAVRALGLACGRRVQVSMNLIDPFTVGPADAFDAVAARAPVAGAELVGLVPAAILDRVPAGRYEELDLGAERTIESRLARRGT